MQMQHLHQYRAHIYVFVGGLAVMTVLIAYFCYRYNPVSADGQVVQPSAAAVYYVAASGDASNAGTSPSSPWPASKIGSTAFLPGDSILFKRGDTFANAAIVLGSSGSPGLPIRLAAYGTGPNPVLDAGGQANPAISISNQGYAVIENLVIRNSTSLSGGLFLYNDNDILVHNNYFADVATALYAVSCTGNIVFDGNYALNMQGPFPRGQMVQFNGVSGSGNAISNNRSQNILGHSFPEDDINLYKSNGTAASPIQVVSNWIEGGGPSKSGGGILLGDGGGSSYESASGNVLVDVGQYGIAVTSGTHMQVTDNKIYASRNTFTNVGLYVWNQYPAAGDCSAITVMNNQIDWTNADGVSNPAWDGGGCGTINGWSTNGPFAGAAGLLLPNPLWQGTPWSNSIRRVDAVDTVGPSTGVTAPPAVPASVAREHAPNVLPSAAADPAGSADTAIPAVPPAPAPALVPAATLPVAVSAPIAVEPLPPAPSSEGFWSFIPRIDSAPKAPAIVMPALPRSAAGKATGKKNFAIRSIEYRLNGILVHVAASYPDGWNINTVTLRDGTYELTTLIHYADGSTDTNGAIFTVDNTPTLLQRIAAALKKLIAKL